MIDTVVISTRHCTLDQLKVMQEQLQARWGVNAWTGEVAYLNYQGTITNDNNAPIKISIRRQEWRVIDGSRTPQKMDCHPFLIVECSVHKLLLGHNCLGGPIEWLPACRYVRAQVMDLFQADLPPIDQWIVRRCDWAETYDLGTLAVVESWIDARRHCLYPRRDVVFYPLGFAAEGTYTLLRAYAKGPEYLKAGMKRLAHIQGKEEASNIAAMSMGLLRCEVVIKRDLLDNEYNKQPLVMKLSSDWLREVYDNDWRKFLRESQDAEGRVRTAIEVLDILRLKYGKEVSGTLYSAWCCLALRGESIYKDCVSRSTWYRHRKLLENAGVTWIGTDVRMAASNECIPLDFTPSLQSPYRLSEVDPRVTEALACYAS